MSLLVSCVDLEILSHKDQVRFAIFCAHQIKTHLKNQPEHIQVIKTVELWLEDKATPEECMRVLQIQQSLGEKIKYVYSIRYSILSSLVHTICSSQYSGSYAENTAYFCIQVDQDSNTPTSTVESLLSEQWKYYTELRDFDKIAEQILIGK